MKRRSPYGERGLKLNREIQSKGQAASLSLRRAWIEIVRQAKKIKGITSLSLRRAWIEIEHGAGYVDAQGSLSLRRAWIEIYKSYL